MDGANRGWLPGFLAVAVVFALLCFPFCSAQVTTSTYGTDFYLGFMRGIGDTLTSLRVTVGTPANSSVTFVVESNNDMIHLGTVTSDAPVVVDIPSELLVTGSDFVNRQKGIHIFSTGGGLIYVLGENILLFLNHGVFIAYPCISLSDDISEYEYRVISSDVASELYSEVLLVGCEDDTVITISPTQSVSLPQDAQSTTSTTVTIDIGMSHEITLQQMQTLLILSTSDLTGTKVTSNRPLTVLSGNECANVPLSESGCEPFAVQVPPVATWGSEFLLAPFAGRDGPSVYKAVSTKNDTSYLYTCDGRSLLTPSTGILAFTSDAYCYLESSDPIFLVELSFGGSVDSNGDPSIAIVSPIDQHINAVDFISLSAEEFPQNYISVTVASEHYDPNDILFNGEVIDCDWNRIADRDNNTVGYGCDKAIPSTMAISRHTVSHSDEDGLLSVLVYGFRALFPQGYAYLAGQALQITEVDDDDDDDDDDFNFDVEVLPLIDLTTFPGVLELDNTQTDATSEAIVIPDGLIFGDEIATLAFVNENGVISFNRPWKYSFPERFPTRYFYTRAGMAVAAFWSDNDIRKEGAVRYSAFSTAEADSEPVQRQWLDEVNGYVQTLQGPDVPVNERFRGEWILTVLWDHVHPSPHGDDDTSGFNVEELEKVNTYQAVIVTNVLQTYAIFSYMCGDIQWSALGVNRPAVVGFNAEGNYFGNHPLSGFSEIGNAISCTFDVGKRRKRQDEVEPVTMPMELPNDPGIRMLVAECLRLYNNDRLVLNIERRFRPIDPQTLANRLEPCPCHVRQIMEDQARFMPLSDSPNCFVTARPIQDQLRALGRIDLTQMCCYDPNGALHTSTNEGFAGTMLYHHPILNEQEYNSSDATFRRACCEIGFDDLYYCGKYFEQRVVSNCQEPTYSPPAIGYGSGDPHYRTFDRRYFSFQGLGEYDLLRVLDEDRDVDAPIFAIQARTAPWVNIGATVHSDLAFGRPGLSFHVQGDFRIFQTFPEMEEQSQELTGQLPVGAVWKDETCSVQFIRLSATRIIAAFFESGIVLNINTRTYRTVTFLNYYVHVPQTYSGRTQGFLGNLDGDRNNEFTTRENTDPLPNIDTERRISDHLQQHWTRQDFDLFNRDIMKRQTDDESEHVPLFFDELNITDAIREVCEDNPSCIFDFAATGSEDVGMITLNHEKEGNATREEIENFPPNITGDAVFIVFLGEESVYRLTVVDPGDEFTLTVLGGLPAGSALNNTGEGEYVFRWTLETLTVEPLVFVAEDSMNASSTFTPIVEVCACANGGNCTREGLLSTNATVVLNCECTEAFSGTFCEEDRNGCSEIQCFEGVECMDVPAPGVGAVCGACPDGYTGNAIKCYDIDECALNISSCGQSSMCVNTDGGYSCDCMDGFQLMSGTNQCIDVNECDGVNDCQQICENEVGSFSCSCIEGFSLADDNRTCTADAPCGGECSFGCAVIDDEEQCFCPSGFALSTPGGTQCVDQNECAMSPCEQLCTNTNGSFECTCESGFVLQGNQRNCMDVDECFEAALNSLDLCDDPNAACVNLEGTFECECVPGYEMLNGTCQRIIDPPPPPPPPPMIPPEIVDFTAPPLTKDGFVPALQQNFRVVTSNVINAFCEAQLCSIVQLDGQTILVSDLTIEPLSVAIPTSLIGEDELGQLVFSFYIQVPSGFLLREQLMQAVQEGEKEYVQAGFFECPPLCTPELCTQKPTRRALCTIPNPVGVCGRASCRVTFCHACYYADDVRPVPEDCDEHACEVYPRMAQFGDKCFRRWSVCVRRANAELYPKVRARERVPERFKCYEHPCL